MVEYAYIPNKESLILKSHKRSPLFLRMVVLAFAMACGVYICGTCMKQISTWGRTKPVATQMLENRCPNSQTDLSYLHYPEPGTFVRGHCSCNPVMFFAILSTQRSGSGWFETLLNSHVNLSSNGELFSMKERRKNVSMIFSTLDSVYRLDWLSSASKNECTAAVGFKWMLNQGVMVYHVEIVEYFRRRGVSVILLFRRNVVCQLVSVLANSYDRYAKILNGTHKSHVHSPQEAAALSKYKPVLNVSSLVLELRRAESRVDRAMEYFEKTRHMVMYYEDVMKNRSLLTGVQEFLRLPTMELTSRQVKIHNEPLSEQIKNWVDVRRVLTGTPYEPFLYSDR